MFGAWDDPEIAAFWIAVGAGFLSLCSLGWQTWTWRRSGAIIRVAAAQSLPVYDTLDGQRPGEWHVAVTAQSKGRAGPRHSSPGLRDARWRYHPLSPPAAVVITDPIADAGRWT
jgi:hypothetical protein